MHETNLRVRYEETDQMGVVYHGKYFIWFEVGRTELFRSYGLPYTTLEENKIYLPVTEAFCKYKSPARYDDEFSIQTQITNVSPARLVFTYKLVGPKGQVLAEGGTTHAFVNAKGRPLNIKKNASWLWDKLNSVNCCKEELL